MFAVCSIALLATSWKSNGAYTATAVDTNRSEVGPDTKEGKTKADGLWIFGLKPSVSVAGDAR